MYCMQRPDAKAAGKIGVRNLQASMAFLTMQADTLVDSQSDGSQHDTASSAGYCCKRPVVLQSTLVVHKMWYKFGAQHTKMCLIQPRVACADTSGTEEWEADLCQCSCGLHASPAAWANSQGIERGLAIAGLTDFGNREIVGPIAQVSSTPVDRRVVGGCRLQSHLLLIQEEHETGVLRRYSSLRLECRKGSVDAGALKTCVNAACRP